MEGIIKISDYIRWALVILGLIWMWSGEIIIVYVLLTGLVINDELKIINERLQNMKVDLF